MKTTAVYITGKQSIAMMEQELPDITDGEILLEVDASSMCYSTYKAYSLGPEHKRVPDDVAEHPVMTGHEMSGRINQVGARWADRYQVGQRVIIQPAMGLPSGYSPGYSYPTYGGDATYTIIPDFAIERGCVLPYDSTYMANGALAEPMMCIIGAFHASYHTTQYVYEHKMGIKPGGNLALLGAAGPMGLGAIQYAINGPYQPQTIVVTDIDQARLDRAAELLPPSLLDGTGRKLAYLNMSGVETPAALLREQTDDEGFDDIMVFTVNAGQLELADCIKAFDCCINFFAGPTDKSFSASLNWYDVHYESTHVVGTSGGATSDMLEARELAAAGKINPSMMVTHVGGLDAVAPTLENFPEIKGGKKLFYPGVRLPLVAIADLRSLASQDPRYAELADITEAHGNLWCAEAEAALLKGWGVEQA